MPVDWTTVNFDKVEEAPQTPPALAHEGGQGQVNWDLVNFDQVSETPEGSGAGQTSFDPMRDARNTITPYLNYYANRYQRGQQGIDEGFAGVKALTGEISYQDAEAQSKPSSAEQLRRFVSASSFGTIEEFQAKHTNDLFEWIGPAMESLPYMLETTKGWLAGAAGGAIPGAISGAVAGAVGGPAAEMATIPASTLVGLTWGGRAGAFMVSSQIMAGQTYMQLRRNGITHENARNTSIAAGAIMGAIEALQLDQIGGAGKEMVKAEIQSVAGRTLITNAVKEFAKTTALEVNEEVLQELTSIAAETISGVIDYTNNANATGLYAVPTPKDIQDRLVQTAIESAKASAFLVGGSQVSGAALGATIKGAFKEVQNTVLTPEPTAIQEAQQQGQEQAAAQQEQAPKQTLQEGKPLAGGVSMSVEEATAKAAEATKARDALRDQVISLTEADQEVPNDLKVALKQANQELGAAREQKRIVELEHTRANIEEQITKPGDLTPEQKAALEKEAAIVQDKLRSIKLDIANRQADARIADLDTRIGQLQGELSKELAGTKAAIQNPRIESLRRRIDKMKSDRETLDTFRQLVQQRLLTEKDLDEISTKIPSQQAQTLVNLAAKKILQAGRETRWSTQAEIKNNQKLLTTLIRKSGLSQADQGRFIAAIANVQTAEQLAAVAPKIEAKIQEIFTKQEMKDAKGDLAKQLGRIEPKKAGGKKVSKFSPATDLQEVLNKFRDFVNDPKLAAEAEQEYIDALAAGTNAATGKPVVTDEQAIAHEVAMQVGQTDFKNAADVRRLAASLKQMIDTGLSERLQELTERRMNTQQTIARTAEGVQGVKRIKITPAGAATRLRSEIAQVGQWGRSFGHTVFSWEGKLAIAFQDAVDSLYNRLLSDLSVEEPIKKADANKRAQMDRMWQHLSDAIGKKKHQIVDQVVKGSNQDLREDNKTLPRYVNQSGQTVNLETREGQAFSRNEAIQLWMQIKHDESLHKGLSDIEKGNGYTFGEAWKDNPDSTEAVLDRLLTDDEKALGEGLMKFYQEYFPRLAAEYKAETGLQLAENKNYSGPAFRVGYQDQQMQDEFQAQMASQVKRQFFTTGKPGTTIARVDSPLGLAARDAFTNAMQHIATVEDWKAWREPSKMLSRVFSDNTVRALIKQKYGNGLMGAIDTHLKDLTQGAIEKQTDWVRFVNRILSNAGSAFLGLKPLSYPKQLTSWINFGLHVPIPQLISGTFDYFKDIEGHNKILESSTLFQGRYASFDRTVLGALHKQDLGALKGQQVKDWLLMFLKAGDQHVVRAGGWAVYKHVLETTGSQEKALSAFERAFNTTQSSGTMDQLSNLARDPVSKVMTIFLQQPARMAEFQLTAWRRAANFPTRENVNNAVRTSMIIHTAQGLFLAVDAVWLSLISDDEDRKDEAWFRVYRDFVLGPLFPIWGDLLTMTTTEASNWTWDKHYKIWAPKIIPIEALTKTFWDLPHDFLKAMEDGEWDADEMFKVMLDYARGINLLIGGLPLEPPIKGLKEIFDEDSSLYYGKVIK